MNKHNSKDKLSLSMFLKSTLFNSNGDLYQRRAEGRCRSVYLTPVTKFRGVEPPIYTPLDKNLHPNASSNEWRCSSDVSDCGSQRKKVQSPRALALGPLSENLLRQLRHISTDIIDEGWVIERAR